MFIKKKSITCIAATGVIMMASLSSAFADATPTTSTNSFVTHYVGGDLNRLLDDQVLLDLLAIDSATLQKDLQGGQSLAEIGAESGSDEQAVIDWLVEQSSERINQDVKDGKLTQDRATQMASNLPDEIKKMVEQKGFGQKHDTQQSNETTTTSTLLESN